eukprot:4070075-Amphidinium_carterae.1
MRKRPKSSGKVVARARWGPPQWMRQLGMAVDAVMPRKEERACKAERLQTVEVPLPPLVALKWHQAT